MQLLPVAAIVLFDTSGVMLSYGIGVGKHSLTQC